MARSPPLAATRTAGAWGTCPHLPDAAPARALHAQHPARPAAEPRHKAPTRISDPTQFELKGLHIAAQPRLLRPEFRARNARPSMPSNCLLCPARKAHFPSALPTPNPTHPIAPWPLSPPAACWLLPHLGGCGGSAAARQTHTPPCTARGRAAGSNDSTMLCMCNSMAHLSKLSLQLTARSIP